MIFTDRTVIVQKGTSSINDSIILYRGDKEVEIRFTLNEGSPFRFGSGASPNIIEKTEAAYGQLIIKTPNDLPSIFSEIAPTNKGKIIFTITAEMIDEITEVGNYTFQIRLFDESRNSRATIPEVVNGIEIREPIATEDVSTTNEVNVATVGYALTTAGTTEDTFDSQGNYNKTTWGTGDRITATKLNKIEAGIDGVNKKVASGGTGSSGANIDDTTASTTTTYSSNKIERIKEDLSSQIEYIENEIKNINVSGIGVRDVAYGEIFVLGSSSEGDAETFGNVILSTTTLSMNEGASDSFTVKLDKAPTNVQTVTITADNTDVTVSPSSLTFTSDNYNTEQAITVNVAEDDDFTDEYCNIVVNTNNTNNVIIVTITDNDEGTDGSLTSVTNGLVHAYNFKALTNESMIIEDLVGNTNIDIIGTAGTNYGDNIGGYITGGNLSCKISDLNLSDSKNCTILLRTKINAAGAPSSCGIFCSSTTNANGGQLISWGNGKPLATFNVTDTIKGTTNLSNGTTHMLGVILDSANRTNAVTLDGAIEASATVENGLSFSQFAIGGYLGAERNKCVNYELLIYNRPLTTEELAQVYNDLGGVA